MQRTPVPLTDNEREEIKRGMLRDGIRELSTYLRIAALEKTRDERNE